MVDVLGLTPGKEKDPNDEYNCMAWSLGYTDRWMEADQRAYSIGGNIPGNGRPMSDITVGLPPKTTPGTLPKYFGCNKISKDDKCDCDKRKVVALEDPKHPINWHYERQEDDGKWSSKNGTNPTEYGIFDPEDDYQKNNPAHGTIKATYYCCPKKPRRN